MGVHFTIQDKDWMSFYGMSLYGMDLGYCCCMAMFFDWGGVMLLRVTLLHAGWLLHHSMVVDIIQHHKVKLIVILRHVTLWHAHSLLCHSTAYVWAMWV